MILNVLSNVAYLTPRSISARLGDPVVENKCGIKFSRYEDQCWVSFPISMAEPNAAAPAVSAGEEVPLEGAAKPASSDAIPSFRVDEARWLLLATRKVKAAHSAPTMVGVDQYLWKRCDRLTLPKKAFGVSSLRFFFWCGKEDNDKQNNDKENNGASKGSGPSNTKKKKPKRKKKVLKTQPQEKKRWGESYCFPNESLLNPLNGNGLKTY